MTWKMEKLERNQSGYKWQTFTIRSKENFCLAVVGDVDLATVEQNEKNARLMTAAPELLEALLEVEDIVKQWAGDYRRTFSENMYETDAVPTLNKVRAAIQKATGKV